MSSTDPDIVAYNEALVKTLRTADPAALRRFAAIWGDRLGNRGLKQLAKADDDVVEKRLWMMIYDRPDLADLHDRAEEWFEQHGEEIPE
jgi:hypothetical protein